MFSIPRWIGDEVSKDGKEEALETIEWNESTEKEDEESHHSEGEDGFETETKDQDDGSSKESYECVSTEEGEMERVDRERGPNRFAPTHDKYERPQPTLHWMRHPRVADDRQVELGRVGGMSCKLRTSLEDSGIKNLFPIQAAVWSASLGGSDDQHDLCINAATGSGKTLSYVIPICQNLLVRLVPRLRALVVLPTKDLAMQVHSVFETLCKHLGLHVAVAAGAEDDQVDQLEERMLPASSTCTDILVVTPGRLVGLLERSPGFTLEHLKFLVVDESDRLLRQSYHDWLSKVLSAMQGINGGSRGLVEQGSMGWGSRPIKIVLSATLTRDPAKLARLRLHHPHYITLSSRSERYKLPKELKEYKVVCEAEEKFCTLVRLLHVLKNAGPTIVFTSSLETTHNLHSLLTAFVGLPVSVVEYSSNQSQALRTRALDEFRHGDAQVVIASDAMTRGMDVQGVAVVINYDTPVYAKTYVHRAGRTARAGASGEVYTILRKEEVRHFKAMLRKADNNYVQDYVLPEDNVPGVASRAHDAKERVEMFMGRANKRKKHTLSMEMADLNAGALYLLKRQIATHLSHAK